METPEERDIRQQPTKRIMVYVDAKSGYTALEVPEIWTNDRITEQVNTVFGTDNNNQPRKWVSSEEYDKHTSSV